jgi:hypothetical protein
MTRRRCSPFLTASVAVALALSPLSARADMTKAQCIEANTKGQDLRREGKLLAARDQLRACANPSCPALVRDDCTKRLDDVERAQPAIVFDAKDGSGRDVSAVTVTMDARPLAEKLDGTPLQVDPGEHVFVFTMAGQALVTQTFVLKEGDKERRERVVIGQVVLAPVAPPPEASPASSTPPSSAPPGGVRSGGGVGTQKVLGLVVGGVGLAGIGVGSAFGVMTLSEVNQQKKACSTSTCTQPLLSQAQSDHSTAMTDRTISTAAFVAGGALLVTGVVLFFTEAHASEQTGGTGTLVVPSVGPGSGGISWIGEF